MGHIEAALDKAATPPRLFRTPRGCQFRAAGSADKT